MFTIFGYGGQHAYNLLDRRHTRQVAYDQEKVSLGNQEMELGLWRRFVDWLAAPENTWSPLKKLSDQEYEEILQEQIIGIEADLAMIDEEIEKVRRGENRKEKR